MSSESGQEKRRQHHRHHHRLRRWLKRRPWIYPSAVLLLIILAGVLWWMSGVIRRQKALQVEDYTGKEVDLGYRNITWQGEEYRYNNRIRTILYAGIDSDGDLEANTQYTLAPRADSISLVVLDEKHSRISIIALSRDTMTDVRRFTLDGKDRGLFNDHLGYAFTYGDGGKASCRNLSEAVSTLLFGIPVNEYVVTNRSSLAKMMDILGPVEVTVPNDDLADEYPQMRKGEKATITADNIEDYVRSRDTAEDLSNVGRMERQASFMTAAIDKMKELLNDSIDAVWNKTSHVEENMLTSITRNKYLDLAELVINLTYEEDGNYLSLPGENVTGEDHDEFYPDLEAVQELVIDLFYEKR